MAGARPAVKLQKKFFTQILFVVLVSFVGCATNTKIGHIISDPRAYEGKSVSIEGKVTNIFSLIFIKYFELDDGTGSIGVVTNKPLPAKGRTIQVTGEVRQAFSIGDQNLTVVLEGNLEASSK